MLKFNNDQVVQELVAPVYYIESKHGRVLAGPYTREVEANAVNEIRFDARHCIVVVIEAM